MSERLYTIEPEGYRTVTLRRLSKQQMLRVNREHTEKGEKPAIALALRLALEGPKLDDFLTDFQRLQPQLPNLIDQVATAIFEGSYPNVEI